MFTYETPSTIQYLDPQVSYYSYDYTILQNVYETLLWYNGSSSTQIIPWLAQNYTVSADGKTVSFTLRQGIQFQDGEQLNSTAVYFSLNKLLIEDGSSPVSHGTEASWIMQQIANTSLSTVLSGPQTYSQSWADQVLAQNFVQITGQYTFQLNLQSPNAALPYLLAGEWADIVAPDFVMQHDLSMWTQASAGYTLPYTTLSGNATQMMNQYLHDEVATCNAGITPKGCGTTYLDGSYQGSQAGTGPYYIVSVGQSTNNIVLQATPNYWGGAYQYLGGAKVVAHIPTIDIKYVPSETTREIDLTNAAKSGQAMAADIAGTNFYDVADRNAWLNNNTLVSTIPGVSLYGTYPIFSTLFDPFVTNVTNPQTGTFYKFQPFSDVRMRLAFADAVNMTEVNIDVNNKLGQVAINVVPPGLPPAGSYNESLTPRYSFNLTAVQDMLVSAMETPITHFTFANGTAAPSGVFDNTFGCSTLNAQGQCSNPVPQTINLVYATGDTVDQAIFTDIAAAINNVSSTYNMGLTVTLTPVPSGQMITEAFSSNLYIYALGWFADYPWVIDFLGPMLAPGGAYTIPDGWNTTQMANLWSQALAASASDNLTALVAASNAMNALSNQQVMYLWTLYSVDYMAMTSNVHGFSFNPSLSTSAGGVAGPELFAQLY
ncbi:MAG: hypothetical protein JRN15_05880 [Nitrososphaerota archaeon]|nr:hypothetical protein [Nitrososphaerota archaeon]